jgi:hypothetical protein
MLLGMSGPPGPPVHDGTVSASLAVSSVEAIVAHPGPEGNPTTTEAVSRNEGLGRPPARAVDLAGDQLAESQALTSTAVPSEASASGTSQAASRRCPVASQRRI